jgi:hypothetical protein
VAQTLQTLLNLTRFFLADGQKIYFADADLTTCINLARDRVIHDTNCCRSLQFVPAVAGQEQYSYNLVYQGLLALSSPPPARSVGTVIGVNFQWSPSYQPALMRMDFPELSAMLRTNPLIQSMPVAFAVYGQNFYIAPKPANSPLYQMEVDAVWLPNLLVNPTDPELAIPDVLAEILVPLMACKLAHINRRAYDEIEYFEQRYEGEKNMIVAAQPPFSVASYYSS